MRAEPGDLKHAADRAFADQLSRIYGGFDVKALAVIHHIFLVGFPDFCPGGFQLLQ